MTDADSSLQEKSASEGAPQASQPPAGQDEQARALGLLRWVQMAFMAIAVMLFWIADKLITLVWSTFAEPLPTAVTALSALVGFGAALALYRNDRVNRIAHEVVGELSRVTWPSRQETQVSTVVVIITSVIAAAILGAFDAVWSTITDLIYKV